MDKPMAKGKRNVSTAFSLSWVALLPQKKEGTASPLTGWEIPSGLKLKEKERQSVFDLQKIVD